MDEQTKIAADAFVLGAKTVNTPYVPGPLPPPPPGSVKRSGRVRLVAGAAALIVGAVGGFLGWRLLFDGFSFPDEIAGVERVESDFVNQLVELMQTSADSQAGIQLDVAVYGNPLAPQYVMFAAEMSEETLTSLTESGNAPFTGGEVFITDPAQPAPFPVVDFSGSGPECVPNPDGAACMWLDGETLVVLGGVGTSAEQLQPIADQVKSELD